MQSDINIMHEIREKSLQPSPIIEDLNLKSSSPAVATPSPEDRTEVYRSPVIRRSQLRASVKQPAFDIESVNSKLESLSNRSSRIHHNLFKDVRLMSAPPQPSTYEELNSMPPKDDLMERHESSSPMANTRIDPSFVTQHQPYQPAPQLMTSSSLHPSPLHRAASTVITSPAVIAPQLKSPLRPVPTAGSYPLRRSLFENPETEETEDLDENLSLTMSQMIRSPSHVITNIKIPISGGARGSFEFDPDDYEEWLALKYSQKPQSSMNDQGHERNMPQKENITECPSKDEESELPPPALDLYGTGNPVTWTQLVNESGIAPNVYQKTLVVPESTQDDYTESSITTEDPRTNFELWSLSRDDLKRLLDPEGRYRRGENICDYFPFVKIQNEVDGNDKRVSQWVSYSEMEFNAFIQNFSHYCAHLSVLMNWARKMQPKAQSVIKTTTNLTMWEKEVPFSLALSSSFNKINETVVLTQGCALNNIEEYAHWGRKDASLRAWTQNTEVKRNVPPSVENISNNRLLQEIIDVGYVEDKRFNDLSQFLKSIVKPSKTLSESGNALLWLEIGYMTRILNHDNHRKLAEFSRNQSLLVRDQMVVVARKLRERGMLRRQEKDRSRQRRNNIENINSMLNDGVIDKRAHLAQQYLSMLSQQREMRRSLRLSVEIAQSTLRHAMVQSRVLRILLPALIQERGELDLSLHYGKVKLVEGDESPYLIEWVSDWAREDERLINPIDIALHRQSDAPLQLINLGNKLLQLPEEVQELRHIIDNAALTHLKDDHVEELPDEAELLEMTIAEDFDPTIIASCIESMKELSVALETKGAIMKLFFREHIVHLRSALAQLARDRLTIQEVVQSAHLKPKLHWPNLMFGSNALLKQQICRVHLFWQFQKKDPMCLEDPTIPEGSLYEGIRVKLQEACSEPHRWWSGAQEPMLAAQLVDASTLLLHQREIDSSIQARLCYLIECTANVAAREWNSHKDHPIPHQVRNIQSTSLNAYDTLVSDVQRFVSILLSNYNWLLRDIRCLTHSPMFNLMKYEASKIAPYQMPCRDFLRYRLTLPSDRIQDKYGAGRPLLSNILTCGSFHLTMKVNVSKAMVHGGRLIFGLEHLSTYYEIGIRAPDAGHRKGHGREINSINVYLTRDLESWFDANIFTLRPLPKCSGQQLQPSQFNIMHIPHRNKIVANVLETFLMSKLCEEAIYHTLPPVTMGGKSC
eukprot:GHVH01010882.1.p1 GENE.GHVH01010882.1~~GHVH01010882.1.p1  ORF type:complete len:1209 (+),score=208.25 GHVH01010882.1:536-4162(+)